MQVRQGREQDIAIAVEGNGPARGVADRGDRQGIAIHVRIVGEEGRGQDRRGRILDGRHRIGRRHGGVVDR